MKIRVVVWHGSLMLVGPGLSKLTQDVNWRSAVARLTCPCFQTLTERALVVGDEFEVAHRPDCRLDRGLRRHMAEHPEEEGRHLTMQKYGDDGLIQTIRIDQPVAQTPAVVALGLESMEVRQDPVSGAVSLRCPTCGASWTAQPMPGVTETVLTHAPGCARFDEYSDADGPLER